MNPEREQNKDKIPLHVHVDRHKSTNCKSDVDHGSVMYSFAAKHDKRHDLGYSSFMISCQNENFTEPDDATKMHMLKVSASAMRDQTHVTVENKDVKIDNFTSIILGAKTDELSPIEIHRRKMASNCAPDYNMSRMSAVNQYRCTYHGEGFDENGQKVKNPTQVWTGKLASCDTSHKISDQTLRDIRKLVWYKAGGESAKLDMNQIHCDVTSIPAA